MSVASDGSQGNNSSSHPSLDSDGQVVAFDSAADLLPNDGNGTVDVYVHDLDSGLTEAASIGPAGSSFVTNHGSNANISATGRFVVFDTQESNLFKDANGPVEDAVLFDRVTHTWENESVSDNGKAGNDNSSLSLRERRRPLRRVHVVCVEPGQGRHELQGRRLRPRPPGRYDGPRQRRQRRPTG